MKLISQIAFLITAITLTLGCATRVGARPHSAGEATADPDEIEPIECPATVDPVAYRVFSATQSQLSD